MNNNAASDGMSSTPSSPTKQSASSAPKPDFYMHAALIFDEHTYGRYYIIDGDAQVGIL
jgi:hypothetical protein